MTSQLHRLLFALLPLLLLSTGCTTPVEVLFRLKGVALDNSGQPTKDGSFIVRDFLIEPKEIRLVVGDIQLMPNEDPQDLKIFSSLPPLLTPGTEVKAENIGNNGQYPGLWAVNLTPGIDDQQFAPGTMNPNQWKQIRLRFAPAVGSVIGLSSQDFRGLTLMFKAKAQKGNTLCNIDVKLSFEGGLGQKVSFSPEVGKKYQNLIQVDFARWFKDVPIDNLCTNPNATIDNTQNQAAGGLIRDALYHSFSFQFQG